VVVLRILGFTRLHALSLGEYWPTFRSTEIFRITQSKNSGPLVPEDEATTILQNVRPISLTAQRNISEIVHLII
jgi:hypothetical protein